MIRVVYLNILFSLYSVIYIMNTNKKIQIKLLINCECVHSLQYFKQFRCVLCDDEHNVDKKLSPTLSTRNKQIILGPRLNTACCDVL